MTFYARAVFDRNPEKCTGTPEKYQRGIRGNVLKEQGAHLEAEAGEGRTAIELAMSLGVTETELIRYGAITPDPPAVRAAKRNAAEMERLGLTRKAVS